MEKLKPLLPFLLVFTAALLVIVFFFPRTHWFGGVHAPLDSEQIIARSRALLDSLGINVADRTQFAQLRPNRSLIRQTQERYGIERSNKLLRDSVPGFFWEVNWRQPKSLFSISSSKSGERDVEAKEVVDRLIGEVSFEFDTRGELRSFRRAISDTANLPFISREEAHAFAEQFMRRFASNIAGTEDTSASNLPPPTEPTESSGGVKIQNSKRIQQRHRVDYEFRWTAPPATMDDHLRVTVGTAGNLIAHFKAELEVPSQYTEDNTALAYTLALIVVYAVLIVVMAVLVFKRIRSYEIGFRGALLLGSISAVIMGVEFYFSIREQLGWEILIPLVLGPLFIGGALVILWAAAESVARETWKDKYVPLDLLLNGHVFHSHVGASVLKGFAFGAAAFALFLLGSGVSSQYTHLWISINSDDVLRVFDIFIPALHVLTYSVFSVVFTFAFFLLFSVSMLRRYIRAPWVVLVLGAMMVGMLNTEHLRPVWVGISVHTLVGAAFVAAFLYGDALATFVAMYGFTVIKETAALFTAGNPSYEQSGVAVCVWVGVLLVGGVAAQFRKNEISDFDAITPAFAKLISERERLQQELAIARQVQMSFLPKTNPTVAKLDFASRCEPALEVGGDYYDFIEVGKAKLGVAVGDVSGKGTQAAFFMTLTKGFLRALATSSDSPSNVLQSVNKLFYQNVERGVFISMVYGLFDTEKNLLTVARAGHNPVIMRKSAVNAVQTLNPMGLALGLDEGPTFSKSIEEVEIPFQSGDLFVFYTDGFPEAMNKTAEEFGQERLCATVERYATKSSTEILDGVFAEMKSFVGKAKQHDDMTIVVVKVA